MEGRRGVGARGGGAQGRRGGQRGEAEEEDEEARRPRGRGGPPAARKRRRSAGHEEEEFAKVRKWRSRGGGRVGEEVEEVATAGKERMDAGEGRRGSPADGTRLAAEGGRGGAARLLVRPAAFISSRTGVSESRRGGR